MNKKFWINIFNINITFGTGSNFYPREHFGKFILMILIGCLSYKVVYKAARSNSH